jgi:PAS domain-containing protein
MDATLFELIDATGGGCCRLQTDETIAAASPRFVALTGAVEPIGRRPSELLDELPPLGELPAKVAANPIVVRAVGRDGIGRELAIVRVPDGSGQSGGVLLIVDRSGEARLRRSEARLGRQIDDLKAELATREREPKRPRIRSMAELAQRLDEALMRARRYQHQVTIAAIRVIRAAASEVDSEALGEAIVGCVRGVDDVGRADDEHWILVLPHTELAGGEIVGRRVLTKLETLALGRVGVGVAQAGAAEPASSVVERADRVCAQALDSGGGLLLAVALL